MDLIAANYAESSEGESDSSSDLKVQVKNTQEEEEGVAVLPSLPTEILDKFHIAPNISKFTNEMSLASNFTIKKGFYSSFIYLEWRPTKLYRQLVFKHINDYNLAFKELHNTHSNQQFVPLHMNELGSPLPLHVSLSQNLIFHSEAQRDSMLTALQTRISTQNIPTFAIEFEPSPIILSSHLNNAMFLTYSVQEEFKKTVLKQIQDAIHESLKEAFPNRNIEKKYELDNQSLHMSIAQMCNVPSYLMKHYHKSTVKPFQDFSLPTFQVDKIKCDKNREVFNIALL